MYLLYPEQNLLAADFILATGVAEFKYNMYKSELAK
jgi:hypothetical protein